MVKERKKKKKVSTRLTLFDGNPQCTYLMMENKKTHNKSRKQMCSVQPMLYALIAIRCIFFFFFFFYSAK